MAGRGVPGPKELKLSWVDSWGALKVGRQARARLGTHKAWLAGGRCRALGNRLLPGSSMPRLPSCRRCRYELQCGWCTGAEAACQS